MTAIQTTAAQFTTIAVEDVKVGYRYWSVRPGHESDWTVKSVQIHEADYQVDRKGEVFTPTLVTVTRRDGVAQVCELGERISIQGPWESDDAGDVGARAWAAAETARLADDAAAAYRSACDKLRDWDRMTEAELDRARAEVEATRGRLCIARKSARLAATEYAIAREKSIPSR